MNITHNIEAEEELIEEISILIRSRRQDLGISQEQLSIAAFGSNSNRMWVNKIENGKRQGMSIKTLSKVFHVLKIKMKFETY